jgi:hypothetical protein
MYFIIYLQTCQDYLHTFPTGKYVCIYIYIYIYIYIFILCVSFTYIHVLRHVPHTYIHNVPTPGENRHLHTLYRDAVMHSMYAGLRSIKLREERTKACAFYEQIYYTYTFGEEKNLDKTSTFMCKCTFSVGAIIHLDLMAWFLFFRKTPLEAAKREKK